MNCVYTYNGRDYSYAEFAATLHDGLIEELSAKGEVVLDVEIPKIQADDNTSVFEPSTTGMDVRQQARDGETVGEGNAQKEEVAEKEEEKEVVSPTEQVEQPEKSVKSFEEKHGVSINTINEVAQEFRDLGVDSPIERAINKLGFDTRESVNIVLADYVKNFIESELPKKLPSKKELFTSEMLPEGEINPIPIDKKVAPLKDKTTKSKADSLKEIVSSDLAVPRMTGVFYDKQRGNLVATDGRKLVIIKDDNITKQGIFDPKTGKEIKDKYPNYPDVIPQNNPIKINASIKELRPKLEGMERANRFFVDEPIVAKIIEGDTEFFFSPKLLNDIFKVLEQHGHDNVTLELSRPTSAMVINAGDITALAMPLFSIDEKNRPSTLIGKKTVEPVNEIAEVESQVEQPAEFEEVKQAKEKFYKHTEDKGYVEVKRAKPVYIFGTEKAFYVKEGKEFVVSDAITGAEIGRGSTLNNAVASAEENAGSVQNLESARERFTDTYGKSPYAKLQEEFSFTQSIINNAMDAADIIENDALKDVESTAKALDDIQKKENPSDKTINLFQEIKDSYYYKGSKVLHHGSSVERLETDRDGLIWFTDEKRVADDYRKRSIVSNEANLDGYEEDAIESKSAIEVIADEQGINLSKGNIFTGQQRLDNLIDLTDVKDDGNVSNLPDFWDKLNKKGLVEKWDDIDQDYKDELIEEYQDKAVWRLLETEGIYNDIKRNGYDGVIISDVGIDGKIHKAYGLFSLKDFRESSANGISEAYHKAKADGSNPELVKAVEDLLGGNNADAYLDAMENNGIIKRDCE